MSACLNFLNTAEINLLTQTPGITSALAETLIAARPFHSVEESLKVKGMGKNLLARLQSTAEAYEKSQEGVIMLPSAEEAQPVPMEAHLPGQESQPVKKDPFSKRMGRAFLNFLRALVRLLFLVLLIGGIGALFTYGLPYIQRTFIAPLEQNTTHLDALENEISALKTQVEEVEGRVSTLEDSIEAHSVSIQKLEAMQTEIDLQLQESTDETLLALKQEVMMTRALDTLARARLYLAQSNFGLAKHDIEEARSVLEKLHQSQDSELLKQAVSRLDLASNNLPDYPVVASGDLEIAWQILVSGNTAIQPPLPPMEEATPTAFP